METAGGRTQAGGSWRSAAVQVVGALIGLGLLAWCVKLAMREGNRDQLEHLRAATAGQIAGMFGLSLASLFCNGLVFWGLIGGAPRHADQRRPPFWHVQAVNAVATCLALIPFKLSVVYRFFVHRTRDRIPIGTIAAWMAAAAAALAAVCGPFVVAATLGLRGAPLIIAGLAGVALVAALGWWIARIFAGTAGLTKLQALAGGTRVSLFARAARSRPFEHVHAGFDMVGDARAWWTGIAGRCGDLAMQGARFWLAARILGIQIDPASALLLGLAYFALGAASPSGALGVRETGATGLAALMHLEGSERYAGVTLLVTAADSIPTLLAAAAGLVAVRPWQRPTDAAPATSGDAITVSQGEEPPGTQK